MRILCLFAFFSVITGCACFDVARSNRQVSKVEFDDETSCYYVRLDSFCCVIDSVMTDSGKCVVPKAGDEVTCFVNEKKDRMLVILGEKSVEDAQKISKAKPKEKRNILSGVCAVMVSFLMLLCFGS